jgi:RND family efflux transporter MFP subunit
MKLKLKNAIARTVGALLLAAAIAAVFLYEVEHKQEESTQPVRPIKSVVVGRAEGLPKLYFPGIVAADSQVELSFQVAGRLIELPAVRGTQVAEGELLARLDPRDYENQLKDAEADLERAQSSLARIEKALKSQAVSQEDYSRARAERSKAEANLAIRRKALAETRMEAPFDGVVADTYADNFVTISAGKPILKLLDTSQLTITITLSQDYIALGAASDTLETARISVEFAWLPGRSFPARFKNYAASADPITRTYEATFHIEDSEGAGILPDLSGTVVVERSGLRSETGVPTVPSDAVGFDSKGEAFVWELIGDPDNGDVYRAAQRTVRLGRRIGEQVEVAAGLERGVRIASGGVTILTEGRRVRLLDESTPAKREVAE